MENEIKKVIHPDDIDMLIDNIGLNPVPYTLAFGDNATVGGYDGEILVSLKPKENIPHSNIMTIMRKASEGINFLIYSFFFQPADMVNQILNLGLPTPIDVKVSGYDKENNLKIAKELVEKISHVPGAADTHLHQVVDFPELFLEMDRMKLAIAGHQSDRCWPMIFLLNFSDSTTLTPNFWLG